jgi:hypothetical protein
MVRDLGAIPHGAAIPPAKHLIRSNTEITKSRRFRRSIRKAQLKREARRFSDAVLRTGDWHVDLTSALSPVLSPLVSPMQRILLDDQLNLRISDESIATIRAELQTRSEFRCKKAHVKVIALAKQPQFLHCKCQ